MCGIVGYIGIREAYPILMDGLHRLEYRGYDSAGVALVSDSGNLNVYKSKGNVSDLESDVSDKDCVGTVGIAHTRWATHGVPSEANSHPHISGSGDITLVHNGIIENYATLKEQLIEKGYTFKSETDTEVLVQLIQYTKDSVPDCNLAMAVRLALKKVIGHTLSPSSTVENRTVLCVPASHLRLPSVLLRVTRRYSSPAMPLR